MAHTANRLEDNWNALLPLLGKEWPLLNEADWAWINKRYDILVDVVRQRYGGRTEIIQEAAIRDRLNRLLQQVEAPA